MEHFNISYVSNDVETQTISLSLWLQPSLLLTTNYIYSAFEYFFHRNLMGFLWWLTQL